MKALFVEIVKSLKTVVVTILKEIIFFIHGFKKKH